MRTRKPFTANPFGYRGRDPSRRSQVPANHAHTVDRQPVTPPHLTHDHIAEDPTLSFADPTHFARATHAVDELLVHLTSSQWIAPTPCTDWNVARVTQHLVELNLSFANQLRPTAPETPSDPRTPSDPQTPSDLLGRYRISAAALQRALTRTAPPTSDLPTQLRSRLALRVADLLVHGWDIAVATGQSLRPTGDLPLQALTFAQSRAAALQRSGQFAPPQSIDDDAPAIDRLAALSGRHVAGPNADSQ